MSDTPETADPQQIETAALQQSAAREIATIDRQRAMGETVFSGQVGVFTNGDAFRLGRNMAEFLASSTMIPEHYQGRPENVMVAIDYAARLGISPFALMSGMDIVRGRPALRGQLYSGVINSSKLFASRLKFEWRGEEDEGDGLPSDNYGCRAWAYDHDGDRINGPWVDWSMVSKEGWNVDKKNQQTNKVTLSKWNTMRELMFLYRSAAFFGRTQASDLMMGIYQHEELQDAGFIEGDYEEVPRTPTLADKVNSRTEGKEAAPRRKNSRRTFTEQKEQAAQQTAQDASAAPAEVEVASSDDPPFTLAQADAAQEPNETHEDSGESARAESRTFNVE